VKPSALYAPSLHLNAGIKRNLEYIRWVIQLTHDLNLRNSTFYNYWGHIVRI